MANIHDGHRQRLYNVVKQKGIESLTNIQVLEFFLTMIIPRGDVNPTAHALIDKFGSFENVLEAHYLELMKVSGVGEKSAIFLSSILSAFKIYWKEKNTKKISFNSTMAIGEYCKTLFIGSKYEESYVLLLNKAKKLLHCQLISRGGVDYTHIYPERVVELATIHAAYYVVITHNHNAGITSPSAGDILQTEEVMNALLSVNKKLLDHIIVHNDLYVSFVENGFYLPDDDRLVNPYMIKKPKRDKGKLDVE